MGIKTQIKAKDLESNNQFNISLLGFKMAVTEGLTVFNLVDGIVDEFQDESGTDGSASTSLTYNSTDDYYINSTAPDGLSVPTGYSAGFTLTTVTEPDTSAAGTNPAVGSGTKGTFTVPADMTSLNAYIFGSGGGGSSHGAPEAAVGGGGGGFASGSLAVTPGQTISVYVGEGGDSDSGNNTLGETGGFFGGGSGPNTAPGQPPGTASAAGGGLSGIFAGPLTLSPSTAAPDVPNFYLIAGSGGGGGGHLGPGGIQYGGAGGGLTGKAGGGAPQTTQSSNNNNNGGGGTQSAGGQAYTPQGGQPGALLIGGSYSGSDRNTGGGGAGYYGGGSGADGPVNSIRLGGGGSSYYGHPQITSGATTTGDNCEGGGVPSPFYSPGTNEGVAANITPAPAVFGTKGEDGFVLLTGCGSTPASVTSSTIISDPFTANTVPTNTRIVVFEENVGTPTLNTDIVASVSRNNGSNFTTVTLTDSGYVTGSSGQRILTGQADISGQPSGQSMKWKLELANQTVKIHGVSLQWS